MESLSAFLPPHLPRSLAKRIDEQRLLYLASHKRLGVFEHLKSVEAVNLDSVRWVREHHPDALPRGVIARLNEDGTLRPEDGSA